MSLIKDIGIGVAASALNAIHDKTLDTEIIGNDDKWKDKSIQKWIEKEAKKNPKNRHLILIENYHRAGSADNTSVRYAFAVCDVSGRKLYHAVLSSESVIHNVKVFNEKEERIGNIKRHSLSLAPGTSFTLSFSDKRSITVSTKILNWSNKLQLKLKSIGWQMDIKSHEASIYDKNKKCIAEFVYKPFAFNRVIFADIFDDEAKEDLIAFLLIMLQMYDLTPNTIL